LKLAALLILALSLATSGGCAYVSHESPDGSKTVYVRWGDQELQEVYWSGDVMMIGGQRSINAENITAAAQGIGIIAGTIARKVMGLP